jgi:hypothetical protein
LNWRSIPLRLFIGKKAFKFQTMIKRIVSFYTALLAGETIENQKEIDRNTRG